MELAKNIAQILWTLILSLSRSLTRALQWWLNKIKNSNSKKIAVVWLFSGLAGICFICSLLFSITPAGRESISQSRATQTAVAIVKSTSEIETRNAPTETPLPTKTNKPTNTPETPKTPVPTETPSPLAIKFDYTDSAFGIPDLFVSDSRLRIAFDLTGNDAGLQCEGLGEGTIFRSSIPLQFSLTITEPNGAIIYNKDAIESDGSGGGYTCHIEIDNDTGLFDVEDFTGLNFEISVYHQEEQLDTIQLIGDGSKLVSAIDISNRTESLVLPSLTIISLQVNVRSGPGTNYQIVQTLTQGYTVIANGFNPERNWVQISLQDGTFGWVSTSLVEIESSDNISILTDIPPTPTITIPNSSENTTTNDDSSVGNTENPFQCDGGCATPPDPSCAIKGNVNSSGEKIYHVPGGSFYNRTDIKPEEGDRWFCKESEAQAAGFRRSER